MCGSYGLEDWRWVVGFEELYESSDLGRIRSVDRVVWDKLGRRRVWKGKVLRPVLSGQSGYLTVGLSKDGVVRIEYVHRIVMAAWVGPCPDGCVVRHGLAGRHVNTLSNLSYGSREQNMLDCRRDGTDGGRRVRRSDGEVYPSIIVAAEESGCSAGGIWYVCNGQRKTAGGYGWEYCDD